MDEEVPPDVLAVTGSSVAVLLAQIPFYGPMAAVRVGLLGDDFIINPTFREIDNGDLDLIVAGSPDGVVMVEAGCNELPEQDVIEAIDFGYEAVRELISAQLELLKELGIEIVKEEPPQVNEELQQFISDRASEEIKKVLHQSELDKNGRDLALDEIKEKEVEALIAELPEEDSLKVAATEDSKIVGNLFKKLTKKLMRSQILEEGIRVDGRKLDEVRPISCRVGILPQRVHGSGLFNRGLTQVLSIATLGTPGDAQDLADNLNPEDEKRYLHHYNFSSFLRGRNQTPSFSGTARNRSRCFGGKGFSSCLAPSRRFSLCGAGGFGSSFF